MSLAELRARDNWVVYRVEIPPGRDTPTKVPYVALADGEERKADAGDPGTWRGYDQARRAAATGRYDGVGFEFSAPHVGMDIDKCRDPDSGALTPRAAAILALANTYAEPSISATGIHIIGRGKVPRPEIAADKDGKNKSGCEMYGGRRFFAMTEAPLPGHDEIRDIDDRTMRLLYALLWPEECRTAPPEPVKVGRATAAPVDLDDAALIERARAANDGGAFARLWSGDLADVGGDDSAADYRLAFRLAFWTRHDEPRIERLMRASGLVRPKWDEARGRLTWLQDTIANACEDQPECWRVGANPPDLQLVASGEDQADPRHATIADLRRRLAEARREIKRRDEERSEIMHFLGNEKIGPGERIGLLFVAFEYVHLLETPEEKGGADEHGFAPIRLGHLPRERKPGQEDLPDWQLAGYGLAGAAGISEKTLGGYLGKFSRPTEDEPDNWGIIHKRTDRGWAKDGRPVSEVKVRMAARTVRDILVDLHDFAPPKPRNHGGDRRGCPKCGSDESVIRRVVKVARHCADCGELLERLPDEELPDAPDGQVVSPGGRQAPDLRVVPHKDVDTQRKPGSLGRASGPPRGHSPPRAVPPERAAGDD